MNKIDGAVKKTPTVSTKFTLFNKNLSVERYGLCFWTKIRFLDKSEEVYRLTLDNACAGEQGKDLMTRREYLFKRPFREYRGNRFCFVEYCTFCSEEGRFPNDNELAAFGLERGMADSYRKFVKKIIARN